MRLNAAQKLRIKAVMKMPTHLQVFTVASFTPAEKEHYAKLQIRGQYNVLASQRSRERAKRHTAELKQELQNEKNENMRLRALVERLKAAANYPEPVASTTPLPTGSTASDVLHKVEEHLGVGVLRDAMKTPSELWTIRDPLYVPDYYG